MIEFSFSLFATVHRFRVQRSGLRTGTALKPGVLVKYAHFSKSLQFGSKFGIRPGDADAFLLNTYPKRSPGMRVEP